MTNTMKRSGIGRRCFGGERRGIAMMLVVIAMGTATVLTTAFLLSKDNSAAIGENAHDTAASEWTAKSGAAFALAVLQTNANWVDEDPAKLLEGFSIAGGTVSVALCDLNGQAPIGEETELAMTVVADVNGVRTVLQRIISVQPDMTMEESVDPEYGEFGIFAEEGLSISTGSSIAGWPMSPAFKSGAPVKLSASFGSSSGLILDADSELINTELYVHSDASPTLESMVNDSHFTGGAKLPMQLPAIEPRLPEIFGDELPVITSSAIDLNDVPSSTTLEGGRYGVLRVSGKDVTATLDDTTGGVYRFDELELEDGAVLKIQGRVDLMIEGWFYVDDGATLVLADDSSRIRIYAGNKVIIKGGAIGVNPDVAQSGSMSAEDLDEYIHPKRIRLYSYPVSDGANKNTPITIQDGSLVIMSVIAPSKKIAVMKNTTVIGRLTGQEVAISMGARLLYDPVLDNQMGYTAFNGPMYKSNGDPQDGLVDALNDYDTTLGLTPFTSWMMGRVFVEVDAVPFVPPGDPDPRSADKATEKPWPFVAMAIEEGNYVAGDNDERQESLYVPLDNTNFDVDQFYNDGLIIATYTKTSNIIEDIVDDVEDIIEDIGDGVGGLLGGVGGLLGG